MFSCSWHKFSDPEQGPTHARIDNREGRQRPVFIVAELGTSTVELAIFFALVAAILGAAALFLTGTLPQIFASARLANALESATITKARLGSLVIHSIPLVQDDPFFPPPDIRLAAEGDEVAVRAMMTEASELSGVLALAFPPDSEGQSFCLDIYRGFPGECEFERAALIGNFNRSDACAQGQSNPCVITQANALLAARGCAGNDPEPILLTVMYPTEGAFLKSPCAVTETGFPRAIQK